MSGVESYAQSPGGDGHSPVVAPSPAVTPGLLRAEDVAAQLRTILAEVGSLFITAVFKTDDDTPYQLGYLTGRLESWADSLDPRPVATASQRATGRATNGGAS